MLLSICLCAATWLWCLAQAGGMGWVGPWGGLGVAKRPFINTLPPRKSRILGPQRGCCIRLLLSQFSVVCCPQHAVRQHLMCALEQPESGLSVFCLVDIWMCHLGFSAKSCLDGGCICRVVNPQHRIKVVFDTLASHSAVMAEVLEV